MTILMDRNVQLSALHWSKACRKSKSVSHDFNQYAGNQKHFKLNGFFSNVS